MVNTRRRSEKSETGRDWICLTWMCIDVFVESRGGARGVAKVASATPDN